MNPCFISVDIESDGPIPGDYSMVQIGACLVLDTEIGFTINLKPISNSWQPEALAVSGLDRAWLLKHGTDPRDGMQQFGDWIHRVIPNKSRPVFIGNNAPYDWMFVCWYFWHFIGSNPFGYSALDIRSFNMGALGLNWADSGLSKLPPDVGFQMSLSHDAVDDARQQALAFRMIQQAHDRRTAL